MSKESKKLEPIQEEKIAAEIELLRLQAEYTKLETKELGYGIRHDEARSDYSCIYTFYESVTRDSVKKCIADLGLWSRRDPGCKMTINFCTSGGSVIDGLALYDYIRELSSIGHTVETTALGFAASMGGILLQAGDKRIMGQNAYLLIHEVSSVAIGNFSEIEDELKFLQRLQDKCLNILASRSTMTPRQIKNKWKRKDWWLDADEALELGFCDEIRSF